MRLEYQLVLGLIIVFGACAILLGYDIAIQKRNEYHLEKDRATLRKKYTEYCNNDAITAMNGR